MTEQIKKYAPVAIPTLCRAECFIPCIESLSNCVGAEYTEVYVALDFPIQEQHWEGYRKIADYLVRSELKFKQLHVVRRERNYGVYGPSSNLKSLVSELWEKYDRLIVSEDDNVFSPNFLVYINKGLDLFENDLTVDSVCGYLSYNGIQSNKNTFFRCTTCFSAWGYATWKSRIQERKKITTEYFRESLSLKNLIKMGKLGRRRFLMYLSSMCPTDYLWINDVNLTTYMLLESKCQIIPTISLVRNIGVTSGDHFSDCSQEIANLYLEQIISQEKTFEFIGTGYECQSENIKNWVDKEKLFIEKYSWLKWNVVLRQTIRKIIKIILGDFGWKPKTK